MCRLSAASKSPQCRVNILEITLFGGTRDVLGKGRNSRGVIWDDRRLY